ncbi:uncharacterized protein N7482_005705 [Penicillium canariense]|uniref:Uncharacterized protein n=1 Tax=Penicillium canariense TaxID=189055 RepID=A0A9W9I5B0_9EURO|nr:uncharacterized protein N7482_005705 [Penicillium canariense]KAJ5166924.1 hypothetical protein N7482_005705 [Penicillium canariense]
MSTDGTYLEVDVVAISGSEDLRQGLGKFVAFARGMGAKEERRREQGQGPTFSEEAIPALSTPTQEIEVDGEVKHNWGGKEGRRRGLGQVARPVLVVSRLSRTPFPTSKPTTLPYYLYYLRASFAPDIDILGAGVTIPYPNRMKRMMGIKYGVAFSIAIHMAVLLESWSEWPRKGASHVIGGDGQEMGQARRGRLHTAVMYSCGCCDISSLCKTKTVETVGGLRRQLHSHSAVNPTASHYATVEITASGKSKEGEVGHGPKEATLTISDLVAFPRLVYKALLVSAPLTDAQSHGNHRLISD